MAVALAPNGEGLFDIYSWRKIRLHANLGARLLEVDLEYIVALADFNSKWSARISMYLGTKKVERTK